MLLRSFLLLVFLLQYSYTAVAGNLNLHLKHKIEKSEHKNKTSNSDLLEESEDALESDDIVDLIPPHFDYLIKFQPKYTTIVKKVRNYIPINLSFQGSDILVWIQVFRI